MITPGSALCGTAIYLVESSHDDDNLGGVCPVFLWRLCACFVPFTLELSAIYSLFLGMAPRWVASLSFFIILWLVIMGW